MPKIISRNGLLILYKLHTVPRLLTTGDISHKLELWNGKEKMIGYGRFRIAFLTPVTWSPDGRKIAYLSGCKEQEFANEMWVIDLSSSCPDSAY